VCNRNHMEEEKSLRGGVLGKLERVNRAKLSTVPPVPQKKLPLTALAQNMQEGSVQLSDETLLG